MHVLAIDPGNELSAWVIYQLYGNGQGSPIAHGHELNETVKKRFHADPDSDEGFPFHADYLVIEDVACMGMAVGREVFETIKWIARYEEFWNRAHPLGPSAVMLFRREVKMHLCGNNTAKDSNIRCALVDRYGPGKEKAIGKKANPGPLFGIANDVWSALAIAVTWSDKFAANTLAVAG